MNYVVSDIHGCYEKYSKLLETIKLGEKDTLYVLGDVIDRGEDGFRILLDMASRPNVIGLMGNHEAMAIDALPGILRFIAKGNMDVMTEQEKRAAELWFYNGGELSLADLLWMEEEQMQVVWAYMRSMPLYREIEVGEKKFLLLHGGLKDFSPSRPLHAYRQDELLWCRPSHDTIYYADRCVIVGHTPTQLLYADAGETISQGRIFRNDNFIDVDCGCVYEGGRLGCLCLDTMEEIYI